MSILVQEPVVLKRTRAQAVHRILLFLLDSPAFSKYQSRNDSLLAAPPPVNQLPCGREHITKQFILRTADIDESSYEGNERVIKEWIKQLRMDSPEDQEKLATSQFIPVVGDQLTVDRLRGMAKYWHEDINGFEQLDWVLPVFGWFHLIVQVANSLHHQYLGTSAGIGLQRAFDLLNRKGLQSVQTKGLFWHHLDEALWHVGEGSFRACWLSIGNVNGLEELTSRAPEALVSMAEVIYDTLASREALMRKTHRAHGGEPGDAVQNQMIMFHTDLLVYFELRDAIRVGDVGRMEDLLPTLACCFAGGSNPRYTAEVLELLQSIHREWPHEVK